MPLLTSRFLRFLVVGVVNTAVSYAAYAFFLFVGLSYAYAYLLALILGIFFSFKTQGKFVFQNQSYRAFVPFVLCWVAIYWVNIALIREFITLGFNAYVAGALALPVTVVLSYVVQKFIVFRRPRDDTAAAATPAKPKSD